MKRAMFCAIAVLALSAGAALAADPTMIPNTTDYVLATQPMIAGTIVSVSDHAVVVDTHEGEQITLRLDSRTLVPADLSPGMVARIDFKLMDNGDYYAQRINPVREEISEVTAETQHAYMGTEAGVAYAENTSTYGGQAATETHAHEPAQAQANVETQETGQTAATEHQEENLPQTASNQPLIALLGLLALGAAGAVAYGRRPRRS